VTRHHSSKGYAKLNRRQQEKAMQALHGAYDREAGDDRFRKKCAGKIGFAKAAARSHAARLVKETGDPFEFYKCDYCGRWHVGVDRRRVRTG
jgi:hypothetical protein